MANSTNHCPLEKKLLHPHYAGTQRLGKRKKKEESNGSPVLSKNNCKKTVGNSSVVKKKKNIFNLTGDEITLIHILFFSKELDVGLVRSQSLK